jgi:hypothetical protein
MLTRRTAVSELSDSIMVPVQIRRAGAVDPGGPRQGRLVRQAEHEAATTVVSWALAR